MTRTPAHLGDGAYVQDDPSAPGGIIVTKINDLGDDGCDEIYLSKNEVAALLRWLGVPSAIEGDPIRDRPEYSSTLPVPK